jgi:hypothetical protein
MSKGYALDEFDTNKLWIVAQPMPLSQLQLDEYDNEDVSRAVKRGRKLRARREARLKDELM